MREWGNTCKETGFESVWLAGMLFCFEVELHKPPSATSLARERSEGDGAIDEKGKIEFWGSGGGCMRDNTRRLEYFSRTLNTFSPIGFITTVTIVVMRIVYRWADNMKMWRHAVENVEFSERPHDTSKSARENLENERKEKQVFSFGDMWLRRQRWNCGIVRLFLSFTLLCWCVATDGCRKWKPLIRNRLFCRFAAMKKSDERKRKIGKRHEQTFSCILVSSLCRSEKRVEMSFEANAGRM
jgi:hypothetical protein